MTCALPLVLSFLTLISRCWWTLACALPLVLSFLILVTPSCRLSRVTEPTRGWGYTFFRTVAAKKLVGLCKQHCLDAVYLGLYNRHQVGVTPFYRQSRVRQPYRRRHCRRQGDGSGGAATEHARVLRGGGGTEKA